MHCFKGKPCYSVQYYPLATFFGREKAIFRSKKNSGSVRKCLHLHTVVHIQYKRVYAWM
jgi:hypothetical protein